ncbi:MULTISPECIES: hypothetical protein [unclassified Crossiella]|uniref:hypothetical protein n=1 Tax=unclassified Crossiella TaxID=2620835 RepID=UPI001FFF3329|nr:MULTISPECIES: hypothetical protein [unclassified Crossiella]MCK2245423.1 hypothetical protein [Crossiella sp. S99.2]MCK2259075.1 hypothetical protein [Crossiella sp. S99.1]
MLFFDFGVTMAGGLNGVGLRAWEVAAALAEHEDVTILTPDTPHAEVLQAWPHISWRCLDRGDVPITQGRDVVVYGFATDPTSVAHYKEAGATCVFDAIVWPQEYLTYEWIRNAPDSTLAYGSLLGDYLQRVRLADGYFVGRDVEKQALVSVLTVCDFERLLAPDVDPSFDDRICILPVGFSAWNERRRLAPKPSTRELERPTFVWNGGLWNHYHPAAAARGLTALLSAGSDAQLWFLYPQRGTPTSAYTAVRDVVEADRRLGDRVKFCQGGLSLAERISILDSACASLCLYEPRALWDLAPPTRIRDVFVYGLPVVAPRRGALGDLIIREGFGITVDTLEPDAVAAAMQSCLDHDQAAAMRTAATQAAAEHQYEHVAPTVHTWLERIRNP